MLFTHVQGATVILHSKGVWRQAPVFLRKGRLYAKYGSGYIGLHKNGSLGVTSIPTTTWEDLVDVEYKVDNLGRVIIAE